MKLINHTKVLLSYNASHPFFELNREDEGNTFLCDVGNNQPDCKASQPRKPRSTFLYY
jgi:hypothetical protein